ncbi:hypothetical protein N8R28_001960 [Campylobacter coli]|nr:hypothetical protein [Campylobacter coli]
MVQQAQKLFDKLKNLDFKKEINIEKDIKLDHIENSLDNSIKNGVQ